ncbi:DUF1674 domain-containing protein [Pelagibius sp.]|uniref:DUF1674 domain-containing protein n=1 Tax=Pelagibius sp. TaxID=1931238 RepID=UPI00260AABC2|nr:succinate dehydrogenase assembly factor 4 [Pelagibius sp.]
MFEKFTTRRPEPRKGPVEPLKPVPETADAKSPESGKAKAAEQARPKEIDGPSGPEPTRYGDWERKGICVDF